jgi:hypothetical protein
MKTSLFDLGLIISGLTLLTTGLLRAFPIKVNTAFLWNTAPMVVAFLIMTTMIIKIGGLQLAGKALDASINTASSFLITMVLLMPIIGMGMLIARHYEAGIARALESAFGYPIALVSSFVSPSGSALSGLVVKMWDRRHLRPLLLYFMTVVPLISLTIFYIRQLGLGTEITKAMYRTNWIVAVGLWPCFWIWGRFFYRA